MDSSLLPIGKEFEEQPKPSQNLAKGTEKLSAPASAPGRIALSRLTLNSPAAKPPAAKPPASSSRIVTVEIPGYRSIKLQLSNKPSPKTLGEIRYSIDSSEADLIAEVSEDIRRALAKDDHDDGSLAPVIVRLAWHCCATYDKVSGTGGSNGATMRFLPELTDEGNNGLDVARAALEPVKFKHPRVTYSDLWTLAGKVAIEEMGGPAIAWKGGRVDCPSDWYVPPNGRLPFATKDAQHVRSEFSRMGFTDCEAVALIGCHAVGRCHKQISGWDGKWTREPTKFSNMFFRALVEEQWELGTVPETGRQQYYNRDRSLMMLNTDMELLRDALFCSHVYRYAGEEPVFFAEFAQAFAKLLELGITRDSQDRVLLRNILPLVAASRA